MTERTKSGGETNSEISRPRQRGRLEDSEQVGHVRKGAHFMERA